MANNTRDRVDALQAAARALIVAREVDVTVTTVPRALASEFSATHGCALNTARRHLSKAARQMRGEATEKWGGGRDGAGRKAEQVTVPIGKDGMETLRAMAKIRQRDPEALAAELLSAALAAEWAEYDQSVTEWSGEIL